ncbi:MAG: helix-turn-helix domain-containing protein [Chitinophagales bacterium]|nr:helix-turn-helix domain-containing protein [Chitinophagales bacterium]
MKTIHKSYKYRIYPSETQAVLLAKAFRFLQVCVQSFFAHTQGTIRQRQNESELLRQCGGTNGT